MQNRSTAITNAMKIAALAGLLLAAGPVACGEDEQDPNSSHQNEGDNDAGDSDTEGNTTDDTDPDVTGTSRCELLEPDETTLEGSYEAEHGRVDIRTDADLRRFQNITEVVGGLLAIVPESITVDCIELPNLRRVERDVHIQGGFGSVEVVNLPVLQQARMFEIDDSSSPDSELKEVYAENLTRLTFGEGMPLAGVDIQTARVLERVALPRLAEASGLSVSNAPELMELDVSALGESVGSFTFIDAPKICQTYIMDLLERFGLAGDTSGNVVVSNINEEC